MLVKLFEFPFLTLCLAVFYTLYTASAIHSDNFSIAFKNGLFYVKKATEPTQIYLLLDSGGPTFLYTNAASFGSDFYPDASKIPSNKNALFYNSERISNDFLSVLPQIPVREANLKLPHHATNPEVSGVLGHIWFKEVPILKDFRNQTALLHPKMPQNAVAISLMEKKGTQTGFRSLEITVAGESYHFLLQTGAYILLTKQYEDLSRTGKFPSGYISESIYKKWAENTDWLILPNADKLYGSDIIRAEELSLNGVKLPFAWFSVRPDHVYKEYFSQWTAETVVGGLGPDAFATKSLWIDIPNNQLLLK